MSQGSVTPSTKTVQIPAQVATTWSPMEIVKSILYLVTALSALGIYFKTDGDKNPSPAPCPTPVVVPVTPVNPSAPVNPSTPSVPVNPAVPTPTTSIDVQKILDRIDALEKNLLGTDSGSSGKSSRN